ncbi:hypothetical protein B14911_18625 [Bacillus sp. NRRL B-14911]|nr:hypothetical protein B14911_18625 [Bacillus sp. NRRL B-14911]
MIFFIKKPPARWIYILLYFKKGEGSRFACTA